LFEERRIRLDKAFWHTMNSQSHLSARVAWGSIPRGASWLRFGNESNLYIYKVNGWRWDDAYCQTGPITTWIYVGNVWDIESCLISVLPRHPCSNNSLPIWKNERCQSVRWQLRQGQEYDPWSLEKVQATVFGVFQLKQSASFFACWIDFPAALWDIFPTGDEEAGFLSRMRTMKSTVTAKSACLAWGVDLEKEWGYDRTCSLMVETNKKRGGAGTNTCIIYIYTHIYNWYIYIYYAHSPNYQFWPGPCYEITMFQFDDVWFIVVQHIYFAFVMTMLLFLF
jgi:hypothetical protein